MATESIDWSRFFERYRAMAVRFARGLTGDEALAEDLFQEAAHRLWVRASSGVLEIESQTHARNYLFRSLRNLAAKSRTRTIPESVDAIGEPPDREPIPPEVLARREDPTRARIVDEALRELEAGDRELLRRRYLEGRTLRQLSEVTGQPISTLHSRIEALLRKIRKAVGNPGTPG